MKAGAKITAALKCRFNLKLAAAFAILLYFNASQLNAEPGQITEADKSTAVEVEKWEFGVVTDRSGPTKDWHLHPVVVIPNLPGIQYAWKLKTNSKLPLFVREEFTLPEPPSTWKLRQGDSATELSKGGEQCILESFQATDEGWVGHAWTQSHGDPSGNYQIKVYLNGQLAHHFNFNVGEAPSPDKNEKDGRDW